MCLLVINRDYIYFLFHTANLDCNLYTGHLLVSLVDGRLCKKPNRHKKNSNSSIPSSNVNAECDSWRRKKLSRNNRATYVDDEQSEKIALNRTHLTF